MDGFAFARAASQSSGFDGESTRISERSVNAASEASPPSAERPHSASLLAVGGTLRSSAATPKLRPAPAEDLANFRKARPDVLPPIVLPSNTIQSVGSPPPRMMRAPSYVRCSGMDAAGMRVPHVANATTIKIPPERAAAGTATRIVRVSAAPARNVLSAGRSVAIGIAHTKGSSATELKRAAVQNAAHTASGTESPRFRNLYAQRPRASSQPLARAMRPAQPNSTSHVKWLHTRVR